MTNYTASNRTNGNIYSVVSISAEGTFKLQAVGRKPFAIKFDAFAERYDLIGEEGKPVSIDDTVQRIADEEAANVAIIAQAEEEPKQEAAPETESKKESKPSEKREKAQAAKAAYQAAIDAWLEQFKATHEQVVIKTWDAIPNCRSLKVGGVTFFEIYFSAKGYRLNAKSSLIPEDLRPTGSNIIKNGLDLTIPTSTDVEKLQHYADTCIDSLSKQAKAKEEAKAAKTEQEAAAK